MATIEFINKEDFKKPEKIRSESDCCTNEEVSIKILSNERINYFYEIFPYMR